MTSEEFKDICLREFPLIEGMVKAVNALGVRRISCDVWEDGHITFSIKTQERFFTAFHSENAEKGSVSITAYDIDKEGRFMNATYPPECFYQSTVEDDTTEDDLPFT